MKRWVTIVIASAAMVSLLAYLGTYFSYTYPYYDYVDYTAYEDIRAVGVRLCFSGKPAPYPPRVSSEFNENGTMKIRIDRAAIAAFEKDRDSWIENSHDFDGMFSIYVPIYYLDRILLRRDYFD